MRCAPAYVAICVLSAGTCGAQEGRDFVGSEACRGCHPKHYAGQRRSAHAASLHRAERHPLLSAILEARKGMRPPDFYFEFGPDHNKLWVTASRDGQTRRIRIDWAFGAGNQGVTFVSRLGPQAYLEHALTYYPRKKVFDLTPAHERVKPDSIDTALGIAFQTYSPGGEIVECFQCHSTGPVEITSGDEIAPFEHGIGCEACHGAGGSHRVIAQTGSVAAIDARRGMSGIETNQLCGQCHRAQTKGNAELDLSYPWNVRHQPPYLERSVCFQRSSGALSCLTCHNSHSPLERNNSTYYDAKCTSCHGGAASAPATVCRGDCVSCHMPQVRIGGGMQFLNHRIAVYGANRMLPIRR